MYAFLLAVMLWTGWAWGQAATDPDTSSLCTATYKDKQSEEVFIWTGKKDKWSSILGEKEPLFSSCPDTTTDSPQDDPVRATGSSAPAGVYRSTVPPLVTDTLSILAELAYEKARTHAYRVLAEKLTSDVCSRLVIPTSTGFWVTLKDGTRVFIGLPEGALLPSTCDTLGSFPDFVAMANGADRVVEAVERDLLTFATGMSTKLVEARWKNKDDPTESNLLKSDWLRGHLGAILKDIEGVIASAIREGAPPSAADGQLVIAKLLAHVWNADPTPSASWERDAANALTVGFRVAQACAAIPDGACSPEVMVKALDNALKQVGLGSTDKLPPELKSRLQALVMDIVQLQSARTRTDQTARARAAFSVLFDTADFMLEVAKVDAGTEGPSEDIAFARDLLNHLRTITLAVIDQDAPTAVTAAAGLVLGLVDDRESSDSTQCDTARKAADHLERAKRIQSQAVLSPTGRARRQLRRAAKAVGLDPLLKGDIGQEMVEVEEKVMESTEACRDAHPLHPLTDANLESLSLALHKTLPVVTVLASNAKSLSLAEEDSSQAEALRQSRKDSLAALVEASTRRDERGGEWVASLGANAGPGVFLWWDPEFVIRPIDIPMGLAVQHLPRPKTERAWAFGFHSQLSLVDLAQFLPDAAISDGALEASDANNSEVDWYDFTMIGLQVGPILGRPENAFTLGFDARISPTDAGGYGFMLGAVISYYVPFFDIN